MKTGLVGFFRQVRRRPLGVLLYVLALCSGLTACLIVYTILDHFFLRPLPFPESDRLVAIYSVSASAPSAVVENDVERRAWQALRASPAFQEVGGWFRRDAYWGNPAEDFVAQWWASSSLFEVLGVTPAVGRLFTAAEDEAPSDVTLLSWDSWQRRFGGRADVLGQTVTLTDAYVAGAVPEVRKIVGILPRDFKLQGDPPEVVVPIGSLLPSVGSFLLIARLAPGVRPEVAQSVANSTLAAMSVAPNLKSARVISLRRALSSELAPPPWVLIAIAAVLLGITVTSVASLLVNDFIRRSQEFAVRLALGADRASIRKDLVVEYSIQSVVAALAAVGLAYPLLQLITSAAPAELLGNARLEIDSRVLVWGLGGATLGSLALGTVPAIFASSGSLAVAGSPHGAPSRRRMQKVIATLQLAISLMLVVCATLFMRTLLVLTSRPIGFDASNIAVISFRTTFAPTSVTASPGVSSYLTSWTHTDGMLQAVSGLPGVLRAAAASSAPFGNGGRVVRLRHDSQGEEPFQAEAISVTRDYFRTLGVPILAGREFEEADRRRDLGQAEFRVIVSQSLDRVLGGNSVGRRLLGESGRSTYEIVGVVGDVVQRSLLDSKIPVMYSLSSAYDSVQHIFVRTSQSPSSLLPTIRGALQEHDRSVLITRVSTMSLRLADSLSAQRFRASLTMAIGAIALGLAAVGMFLLGMRFVQMRRREIGVRLALGATAMHVVWLVLRDTVQILLGGIVIGWPLSYFAIQAIQSLLVGVSSIDPTSVLLYTLALVAVVILATTVPARLALRIDPARAVRSDG